MSASRMGMALVFPSALIVPGSPGMARAQLDPAGGAAFFGVERPKDVPASQQERACTSPVWYTP